MTPQQGWEFGTSNNGFLAWNWIWDNIYTNSRIKKFKKYIRIATYNGCHYLTISLLMNSYDSYTQQKQRQTASHEKHSFQSTLLFGVQSSIGHSVNEKTGITASLSHLELFEWHFWCLAVLRVCLGDWSLLNSILISKSSNKNFELLWANTLTTHGLTHLVSNQILVKLIDQMIRVEDSCGKNTPQLGLELAFSTSFCGTRGLQRQRKRHQKSIWRYRSLLRGWRLHYLHETPWNNLIIGCIFSNQWRSSKHALNIETHNHQFRSCLGSSLSSFRCWNHRFGCSFGFGGHSFWRSHRYRFGRNGFGFGFGRGFGCGCCCGLVRSLPDSDLLGMCRVRLSC